MLVFAVVYSVVIALLGILLGHFPNLVSGGNDLTPEQRRNIDSEAIGRIMQWALIIGGCGTLVGYLSFWYAGHLFWAEAMLIAPVLLSVGFALPLTWRYNHNPHRHRWLSIVVFGVLSVVAVIGIVLSLREPGIDVSAGEIHVSGSYAVSIPTEGTSVSLVRSLPQIGMHSNGVEFGPVHKGYFRLAGWGRTRLFLRSINPPFVVITPQSGVRTVINGDDSVATLRLFRRIDSVVVEH